MTTDMGQPRLRAEHLSADDRGFAERMLRLDRKTWSGWAYGRASALICCAPADPADAALVEQLRLKRDGI